MDKDPYLYSEAVKNSLLKKSSDNLLFMDHEMDILKHLINKFNLHTQSAYAKSKGISAAAVSQKISRGKLAHIKLKGVTFVVA